MTRSLVASLVSFVAVTALFSAQVHAHPSWGIAVDPQRQVYFSDLKTVWKIDAYGKLSVVRAEGDRHTHDLNIDEAGNLYGADNSYEPATQRFFSAIWTITSAGSFSYLLPLTENPPKGTSIWKDRDGNMYHVTNYPERELLVLKRTPNGSVTALAGSSNAAREYRQTVPYSTGGIAFSSEGALYFVHGANVSKITTSGTLVPLARNVVVENGSGDPTSLFGISVDAQGHAFVADYGNRRVMKVTQANQITTVIRAEEPWFPTGVAIRDGELYILEYGHTPTHTPIGTRVRKLSTDGRITTLATVTGNGASSGNPSADESRFGETPQRAERRRYISYALIGAGIGLLTLMAIVWRVRRRKSPST
jgi:sugar lactone lactonase YvrE